MFGLHRSTVGRWWHAYQRHGADALLSRRRGRKPRPLLQPNQQERLLGVVRDRAPDQLGLPETLWTRAAVADWAAGANRISVTTDVPMHGGAAYVVNYAGTDYALAVNTIPASLDNDSMRAAWMVQKGCEAQAEALVRAGK